MIDKTWLLMNLNYLKYVLRHKWYVLIEGVKLDVPLWGLLIHDWQKFTPTEWQPYALSFYGPWSRAERPDWLVKDFKVAWLHHMHYGPHHWEYWLLRDGDGVEALEMPYRYQVEMLADWHGAGLAISGKKDTAEWYKKTHDRIILHPTTRFWVEDMLGLHEMNAYV
ncbi:MAG: hypothetical protein FOGNACKC_00906 [Anaerolineae bacterium]|nr:hypothetical protein [Anaerolineae bacterium]